MSRNRLLAVFAAVVLCTCAFMLWQRAQPARPVNTGGAMTPASSAEPAKTGTVER
jgi:hypothetical protein